MENFDIITDKANALMDWLAKYGIEYSLRFIGALVILIIGLWVIKIVSKKVYKLLDVTEFTPALKSFIKSLTSITLKLVLFISILGMIGVEMTTFIAMLTAASLAVAMAFNGTLSNFAGGVMILFFKPFKVGDYIDAQGYAGSVKEIQIFVTVLTTPDNKTILIPNGPLSNNSLVNYSTQDFRRVDWSFGIGYGDDYDAAKKMLMELIKADKRILDKPAEPFIALGALADSSVNITVRVWVEPKDYWAVFFEMNENFYKNADKHNINIPFPQLDVHINK